MIRAARLPWVVGLAATLVIGSATSGGTQSTAPPLTACELARLRSVPRWELDFSYRLSSTFTASGDSGAINSGFFLLKNWTYSQSLGQEFRVVVQAAAPGSRPSQVGPECSRVWPCEPVHPASLTVTAHVDSRSLEGSVCPGQHGIGCPGPDVCFEGGHPFCGDPCHYSQQSNITTAAPSATLDGTTGRRVAGELYFDFDVNPPRATTSFGISSPFGALRNVIAPCLNGPQDNTAEVPFSAFTDFAPYPTSGGDTAVRLVDGRFVVQGEASGSDTRMVGVPVMNPQPTASFPRTWNGSATWTIREADEPIARVVGIEVNQAVQDWRQSVPLIRGKPAVVRAHLDPVSEDIPLKVKARLRGFKGGVELPGSPLPEEAADVFQEARDGRTSPRQTLDWMLPPAWLDGDVELCLEPKTPLGCGEPAEPGGAPGDCSVRVSFRDAPPLRVKLVAVEWGNPLGTKYKPAAADLDELEDRLAAIYPTARLDATRGELRLLTLGSPDWDRINRRLDTLRLADCAAGEACDRTYYGVLTSPSGAGFPLGGRTAWGLANGVPGTVSSGIYPAAANHYARHVHSHEIGHVLGRPHAVDPGMFGTDTSGNPQGPCAAVANTGAEVFPFFHHVDGRDVPTLGPLTSGEASKIFGFDTHWNRIIDPFETFELMGYCAGTSAITGQSKWISSHTYAQLKTFLASSWFGGTPTPAPSGAAGEVMLLRGTVDEGAETAELLPVLALPAAHAPEPPAGGTYALELRDAGGGLLDSVPLTPLYAEPDAPGAPHDATQGSFAVLVAAAPGTAEVGLLKDGSPKASVRASAHPPTVTVQSPNGGEEVGPGDATLVWDAADEDDDTLTFLVQWSRDGGGTWETLDTDRTETTLVIDTDVLAATTTGRLRVVASDGFLTAVDESDGDFTVPPKPPRVRILPPTGTVPIVGARAAVLRGAARDVEDGPLADARLRWSSDLNGNLGTGGTLVLDGSVLVWGLHTLTLQATDSDGLTGTATVPLIVVREGSPICGDGTVDTGEACDDGNLLGDDECSADCLTSITGSTTTTTIAGSASTTTTTTIAGSPRPPRRLCRRPRARVAARTGIRAPRTGASPASAACTRREPGWRARRAAAPKRRRRSVAASRHRGPCRVRSRRRAARSRSSAARPERPRRSSAAAPPPS